jgi:uncharacterized C2H2 Zn-finger protein
MTLLMCCMYDFVDVLLYIQHINKVIHTTHQQSHTYNTSTKSYIQHINKVIHTTHQQSHAYNTSTKSYIQHINKVIHTTHQQSHTYNTSTKSYIQHINKVIDLGGRDHMVVGFTTIYAISAYHH